MDSAIHNSGTEKELAPDVNVVVEARKVATMNIRVRTHEPQRAVTPGQAAVFYCDDLVRTKRLSPTAVYPPCRPALFCSLAFSQQGGYTALCLAVR
ncbi:MAG: aminomethyltransferase beta-barrel domain-containing protein [Verrucomicrobiia bacterium]